MEIERLRKKGLPAAVARKRDLVDPDHHHLSICRQCELLDLNRSSLVLTLYRAGKVVMSAHVGIGSGANPTPRGDFYVREKFRVKGSPVYGPFALGTSAYAPHLTDWPGGGVVVGGSNATAYAAYFSAKGGARAAIRIDTLGPGRGPA
jgi:hypothetical protein